MELIVFEEKMLEYLQRFCRFKDGSHDEKPDGVMLRRTRNDRFVVTFPSGISCLLRFPVEVRCTFLLDDRLLFLGEDGNLYDRKREIVERSISLYASEEHDLIDLFQDLLK